MSQVHDKFKFFSIAKTSKDDLLKLFSTVEDWVKTKKVAPKSIGIISLNKKIIMSLGFQKDKKKGYEIKLTASNVTDVINNCIKDDIIFDEPFDQNDDILDNIICHELFAIDNKLYMIFMNKK